MILFSVCISAIVAICDIVASQGDDDKMCWKDTHYLRQREWRFGVKTLRHSVFYGWQKSPACLRAKPLWPHFPPAVRRPFLTYIFSLFSLCQNQSFSPQITPNLGERPVYSLIGSRGKLGISEPCVLMSSAVRASFRPASAPLRCEHCWPICWDRCHSLDRPERRLPTFKSYKSQARVVGLLNACVHIVLAIV